MARIAEALGVRENDGVEPMYRPLLEACRKYNLGKRDVDRLMSVVRTMFA